MTYWVHLAVDGQPYHLAQTFDPPAPKPIPGKGFPLCFIEFDRAILIFPSLDELRICIQTLDQRVLPSNRILTQKRGGSYGPSNHWLNRLPLRAMTWPYRQKAVKFLKVCLADFEGQR